MKKIIFMALVILASAMTVNAAGKNDKKNKKKKDAAKMECCANEEGMEGQCDGHCKKDVKLITSRDSISYAAGVAVTNGLLPYLQGELGLDTMYMADFQKGFEDARQRGTDPKYVAYTAGIQIAQMVEKRILPRQEAQFANTPDSLDTDIFYAGFIAGAMNDTTLFKADDAQKYAQDRAEAIKKAQDEALKTENTEWLEQNKTKDGVVTLPSGLQYKVITKGTGKVATKDDNVTVKYEGKTIDGKVFDSSYSRNPDTTTFKPTGVIKGWTEALCMMPEGSKWELYIPYNLAYGERGNRNIKPYATLIFTVEVVKVEEAKQAETPAPTTKTKPAVTKKK